MTNRSQSRLVEVLEQFAEFSSGIELPIADEPWHPGVLQRSWYVHQTCVFVRGGCSPFSTRVAMSRDERKRRNADMCAAWRLAHPDLVREASKVLWERIKSNPSLHAAKCQYQREYNRNTKRPAAEWAALKADPARHAAELEKSRARYRARKARQSSSQSSCGGSTMKPMAPARSMGSE